MELVTPECFDGLSEEEKQEQTYLAYYLWADDPELLAPECFLGYPHREEVIYAALRVHGGSVEPECIEGLSPDERYKAMYEAVYEAASDPTLTHPDCFLSLSPEVRDLAYYTALYVIAGGADLDSPECFLGSSQEERSRAVFAAVSKIQSEPVDPIARLSPSVWFKADALDLEDEDPVGVFPDSSGNGNDAAQGAFLAMPTYRSGGPNGMPFVSYDGIDDTLLFGEESIAGDMTLVVVARRVGGFFMSIGGNVGTCLALVGSTVTLRDVVDNDAASATASGLDEWCIITAVREGSGVQVLKNGAGIGSGTSAGTFAFDRLGSRVAFDQFGAGEMSETLIFRRALSPPEIELVNLELGAKYGITIPVPPSDPILALEPTVWLKADSLDLEDEDLVDVWPDSSGNGDDASQGSFIKMPSYLADGINGKPALLFDGVDDLLEMGGDLTSRQVTILIAYTRVSSGSLVGTSLGSGMLTRDTQVWPDTGFEPINLSASINASTLCALLFDYDANIYEVYLNGALAGRIDNDGKGPRNPSHDPFAMGRGFHETLNGRISEVIIFDKILSLDALAIPHQYLASKYSITLP